jgi:hypothetical protein
MLISTKSTALLDFCGSGALIRLRGCEETTVSGPRSSSEAQTYTWRLELEARSRFIRNLSYENLSP